MENAPALGSIVSLNGMKPEGLQGYEKELEENEEGVFAWDIKGFEKNKEELENVEKNALRQACFERLTGECLWCVLHSAIKMCSRDTDYVFLVDSWEKRGRTRVYCMSVGTTVGAIGSWRAF